MLWKMLIYITPRNFSIRAKDIDVKNACESVKYKKLLNKIVL